MARGKVTVYEGGVRVPFIARWPRKIDAGQRSKELVSTTDLLPTFLDVAGLAPRPELPTWTWKAPRASEVSCVTPHTLTLLTRWCARSFTRHHGSSATSVTAQLPSSTRPLVCPSTASEAVEADAPLLSRGSPAAPAEVVLDIRTPSPGPGHTDSVGRCPLFACGLMCLTV